MNILFLSSQALPQPGGVNTYVSTVIPKLKERGHNVKLFSASDVPKLITPSQRREIDSFQNLALLKLKDKMPEKFIKIESAKFAFKCMLQNLDLTLFDIVHSQDGISSAVVKSISPNIPVVATLHGSFYSEFINQIPNATPLSLELIRRLDQQSLSYPDYLITVSNYVDSNFINFPYHKHKVVFNGIDIDYFKPFPKNNNVLQIVTSGSLIRIKGYDIFLESIKQLKNDYTFEVNMFGGGLLREQFENFIKDYSLPVLLKGHVDHKTLAKELRKADIFVQPSRLETFGLSITEAMSSGCVPIASNVGGIPDQITNGVNGFLTVPENVSSITQALECLITDAALRQKMSVEARKTAVQRFSLDVLASSLEEVYHKTIGI